MKVLSTIHQRIEIWRVGGQSMGREFSIALGFVCLMLMAPLSGCFGNEESSVVSADSLDVTPTIWTGGIFQTVTFEAQGDLSVFIPYLVKDSVSGYVFNSTVLNLEDGERVELSKETRQARLLLSSRRALARRRRSFRRRPLCVVRLTIRA